MTHNNALFIISHDGQRIGAVEGNEMLGGLEWFAQNCRAYSMHHAVTHEGYSVERVENDEIDCNDVAQFLEDIAARVGLTMGATFVPFSHSRSAKEKNPSLNWKVTLKHRDRELIETDYMQGCAHAPAYSANLKHVNEHPRVLQRIRDFGIKQECETGKLYRFAAFGSNGYLTNKPIDPPRLGDVLHSLVRDSDVLESSGFEDWASELGFDTDSRNAESIYRQCLEIGLKLRSAIGGHALEELRTVARFN